MHCAMSTLGQADDVVKVDIRKYDSGIDAIDLLPVAQSSAEITLAPPWQSSVMSCQCSLCAAAKSKVCELEYSSARCRP
jgi:hypothetical protein